MTDDSYSSTHPPLPPTTEDDRILWLRLLRSRRVGVSTFWRMLGEHGTARAALDALPDVARKAGLSSYTICPEGVALSEWCAAERAGAQMLCRGEEGYPSALAELTDAPPFLWRIGSGDALRRPMVALVGARNASSLGARMARSLARDLAEAGLTVVSGLARGIDAVAHQAALAQGTVAVQAGGVDVLYPSENAGLAKDIVAQGGARLSEQPMGLQPQARHFPTRNRIVSGLAMAVVVVEAAAKSGSLITAGTALDQGRDVLAVPGHPLDPRAAGCNLLIRDGARLVRSAEDVLEALDLTEETAQSDLPGLAAASVSPPRPALRDVAALHRDILARLGPSPLAEDQLIRDLGVPVATVGPVLTDLEIDGHIQRQPGGLLARIS